MTTDERLDALVVTVENMSHILEDVLGAQQRHEEQAEADREQAEADRQETRKAVNDLTTNVNRLVDTLAVLGFSQIDLKKQVGNHETRITTLEHPTTQP